jgi:hypothetical protein
MNNRRIFEILASGMVCFALCLYVLAQAATPRPLNATSGQASVDKDIQLLREDIASEKKQLIASNLVLTDTEATKFWPIYDQYQAEYKKIGDAKVALIKEYAKDWSSGSVTDAQALQFWQRAQDIDESVLRLRQKYLPIVSRALPGTKTATFFQMDRRIVLLQDVQLASQIPFVQEQNR